MTFERFALILTLVIAAAGLTIWFAARAGVPPGWALPATLIAAALARLLWIRPK